jgi:serine/threonine-protein kinase RCK2
VTNYDEPPRKHDYSAQHTAAQQQKAMGHLSEPGNVAGNGQKRNSIPEAYSAQPGDTQNQNRVAQADAAAAHHVEANQNVSGSRSRSRAGDAHAAKIVQEENENRNKFPKYPGLERWELLEKMGDGAFSNVYRARDLKGNAGEVAIKVVRKFEMNNMQVSSPAVEFSVIDHVVFIVFFLLYFTIFYWPFSNVNKGSVSFLPTLGCRIIGQQASPSGF